MGSHYAGLRLISEVRPLAEELIGLLGDTVIDVVIAGSLRRQPRWGLCHDVDLVFKPVPEPVVGGFVYPVWDRVMEVCDTEPPHWVVKREAGYKRSGQRFPCINRYPVTRHNQPAKCAGFYRGVQIDFYPWYTERQRAPLLVVRTGPYRQPKTYGPDDPGAKQNMALAKRAWRYGLRLAMATGGLMVDSEVVPGGAAAELWVRAHGGFSVEPGVPEMGYYEDLPQTVIEGQHVGWASERHFFAALKLPYCEPHDRDSKDWIDTIFGQREFELGTNWPEPLSLE